VVDVRAYKPADREAVLALAARLTEGVAEWRDPQRVSRAVLGWVRDSLEAHDDPDRDVFVAEGADREVLGFVTVSLGQHWAGDTDVYIGELVVHPEAEGRGVGRKLVQRVERWARERGHATVTLETGAANVAARRFYQALGFREEEVRLSKPRQGDPASPPAGPPAGRSAGR
jgi:ribosomal protein S18 acetylase RimI-like enzyme